MKEVRKFRLLREMTLDEVSIKTKISVPRLSRIERGLSRPSTEEKRLISRTLKEPVEKVFPE